MRKLRPLFVVLLVVLFFSNNVTASTVRTFDITYNVDNVSARSMLSIINEWRQSGDVWCWNSTNTEKVQYGKLPAYTYDYNLEQIALQRAYEVAVSFDHTRPDGSDTWSCTYNGTRSWGECIAAGSSTPEAAFEQWKEENDSYSGQGHRRLMASSRYTSIGIAHVEYCGRHFWVQEYGDVNSGAPATPALKGSVTGTVRLDVSNATFSILPENTFSYMDLYSSRQLPSVIGSYKTSDTWGSNGVTIPESELSDVTWTSSDTSVLSIKNNTVKAVGAGSSTLTVSAVYEGVKYTKTMTVNVSKVSLYYTDYSAPTSYYDLNGAKPKPVIKYNGTKLTEGKDFTITKYSNNTFIGTYAYITVEGIGNFSGTIYIDYEIVKCDINSCSLSGISSATYTGNAITPNVTLTQNGTALTKGTHYTVSYSNNINAGTGKITITGTGNYFTGTRTASFTINRKSLSNATVSTIGTQAYTGSAVTPQVTVKDGDMTLVKGTDYTVTYSNNTNVGTATVTITGKGNYSEKQTITFSIVKKLVITDHPTDYSGLIGSTATFSVKALGTGLTYQWQYYSGGTWFNFGTNRPTVSITVSNSHNGMKYRCIVKDSSGKSVTSNVAAVHITNPLLSITTQPKDYSGKIGSTATFTIVAQGTGLTYQWQYYSGGKWINFGSNKPAASITVSNSHNGMKYRCVVKDSSGKSVTSNSATVHITNPLLSITSNPKDYSGKIGSTATFTVAAQGTGLSYQWQYYSGGAWKNFGSNRPTASITVSNSHNGMKYRCIVKDSSGKSVTSNAATIHITNPLLSITTQPKNYTGAVGSRATFSVVAQGTGLTYQWQYYSGGTWKNFGSNDSTVSLKVSSVHNGMKYRCIVKDSSGKSVTSTVVTIKVN